MDGATLSTKVFAGYGKAASRVGRRMDVYRAQTPDDPLNVNNVIATINAAFTIHGASNFSFDKPSDYNNPLYHGLFDPTGLDAGDYLVDPSGQTRPFFLASITPAMPPLIVSCNRTLSFYVISKAQPLGLGGYAPAQASTTENSDTALMTNWPVSLLRRGTAWYQYLPSDTGSGSFYILCPVFPGVVLRSAMIAVDEDGNRYALEGVEKSDLGWRIEALQLQT